MLIVYRVSPGSAGVVSMMCRPSIYANELINLNLDLYQIHFQNVPMIYQVKSFTLLKI